MPNPFDSVGIERKKDDNLNGWEQVGGTFSCDATGCSDKVTSAFYNSARQILQWTCIDGHVSRIEGFSL